MKALLTDTKGALWLGEVDPPQTGDYDCLVRTEACAFCHSTDRHVVEGSFFLEFPNPSILGHECVGVIEKTGPKVKSLKVGDRILRGYARHPEEQYGGAGSAWGGFAQYGKVTDWQALVEDGKLAADAVPGHYKCQQVVPGPITLDQCLALIPFKEIYSAVGKMGPVDGEQIIITGAGITALFFGLLLKKRGCARVTMLARRTEPLAFAQEQGAVDGTVLSSNIASLSTDYDGLVDTSGSLDLVHTLANSALKKEGTIFSYAVYPGMTEEGFFDTISKVRTFARINPDEPSAHDAAMAMLLDKQIDLTPFITARFPLDEYKAAWQTVLDKTSLKTVIIF